MPVPSQTPSPFILVDPGSNFGTTVFAPGYARVALEPTQLFQDSFDTATLDITNKWLAPVAAGGGVAASNTLTNTQLGTGTTISGYSYLESAVSFPPANPDWLLFYTGVNIVWPIVANQYFFWGMVTSPGSPTAAAPLTNACGFEVGITVNLADSGGNNIQISDGTYPWRQATVDSIGNLAITARAATVGGTSDYHVV